MAVSERASASRLPTKVVVVVCVSLDYTGVFLNWALHYQQAVKGKSRQELYIVCLDRRVKVVLAKLDYFCAEERPLKPLETLTLGAGDRAPTAEWQKKHLIWQYRTSVVSRLLQKGHDVIMSDVDGVWLRDPLADILADTSPQAARAHIIATRGMFPEEVSAKWGATVCMGLAYVRSGPATIALFQAIERRLSVVQRPDDQREINFLLLNQYRVAFRRAHQSVGLDSTEMMHGRSSTRATGIGDARHDSLLVSLLSHKKYPRDCDRYSNEQLQGQAVVVHCHISKNVPDKTFGLAQKGLWKTEEMEALQSLASEGGRPQPSSRRRAVGDGDEGGGVAYQTSSKKGMSFGRSSIALIVLLLLVFFSRRTRAESGLGSDSDSHLFAGAPVAGAPVGILVLHTDRNATHCDCAQKSVRAYAERHDYGYRLVSHEIYDAGFESSALPSSMTHSSSSPGLEAEASMRAHMHPKFQKYVHVKEELELYPSVLLLDCDVVVTSPEITVEGVWSANSNASTLLMIARDAWSEYGYVPFNSGVIIFKRGEWLTRLLDDILTGLETQHTVSGKHWGGKHGLKDQPRLTEELFLRREVDIPVPPTWHNVTEMHEHVSVVSQRVMNSFKRRGKMYRNTDPESSQWRQGDWLAHVTGMHHSGTRLAIMRDDLKVC